MVWGVLVRECCHKRQDEHKTQPMLFIGFCLLSLLFDVSGKSSIALGCGDVAINRVSHCLLVITSAEWITSKCAVN